MLSRLLRISRLFSIRPKANIGSGGVGEVVQYDPFEALKIVKANCHTLKDDTISFCVKLDLDSTKGDQVVRGSAVLPHGTGTEIKIAFICSDPENNEVALQSGADLIITDDVIADIANDIINFDKIYSTIGGLNSLKPYARILGPKGLFPNAKVKTLIQADEIDEILKEAKKGKIDFRIDSGNNIQGRIGKVSFSNDLLLDNLNCVMDAILAKKPAVLKRGMPYFLECQLKSSFEKPWPVYLPHVEPGSEENLIDDLFPVEQEE